MKNYIRIASLALAAAISAPAMAQEVILPLTANPYIPETSQQRMALDSHLIELPFVEDFSALTVFPNHDLWSDQYVYVNGDLAKNPVTIGVATFDGLDKDGKAYQISGGVGPCDTLTSKGFNLDYNPSDSLYLSFYIQAGGYGVKPSSSDSILLEFYQAKDSLWNVVWSATGDIDTGFHWVNLPIVDTNYLQEGFKMRWVNVGNQGGQFDLWHLDYIKLDQGRSFSDSILEDAAFQSRHLSLLDQGYRQVPYSHFKEQPSVLLSNFQQGFANLAPTLRNISFNYQVFEDTTLIYSHPLAADNVAAESQYIQNYPQVSSLPIADTLSRKVFEWRSYVSANPDDWKPNDTLSYRLDLDNYYAYDDGTAELSYGLTSFGARLAYGFNSLKADTLKAIAIHFVQAGVDTEVFPFQLVVWQNDGGVPGNELYRSDSIYYPQFEFGYNGFAHYSLDTTMQLSGSYFVGIRQVQNASLRIGFDRNSDASGQIFYNLGQGWLGTAVGPGALMIRPVFGSDKKILSLNEETIQGFDVYPNPTEGTLWVEGVSANEWLQVYTIDGQLIREEHVQGKVISLQGLPAGIYLLAHPKTGTLQKVIKQ